MNPLLPIIRRSIRLGLDPSCSVAGLGAVLLRQEAELEAAADMVYGTISPPRDLNAERNQPLKDQNAEMIRSLGGLIEWLFQRRDQLRLDRGDRMVDVLMTQGSIFGDFKSDPVYAELEARRLAVERTLSAL